MISCRIINSYGVADLDQKSGLLWPVLGVKEGISWRKIHSSKLCRKHEVSESSAQKGLGGPETWKP